MTSRQQTTREKLQSLPVWGLSDQVICSLCNILGVISLARCLDANQFGAFTLAYSLFALLLGIVRAYFGIPINLAAPDQRVATFRRNLAATVMVTAISSTAIPGITWALSSQSLDSTGLLALVALGAATPLLTSQDLYRILLLATNRPRSALLSDLTRALILIPLLFFAEGLGARTALLVWLMSAVISLAVIVARSSALPDFSTIHQSFQRSAGGVREAAGISTALSAGMTFILGSVITLFTGPATLGALRGSSMLFGPINTLIGFLDAGILGRLHNRSLQQTRRTILLSGIGLSLACLIGTVILISIPSGVGRFLLGATWESSRVIVPIMAVEYIFLSWTAALSLQLKVSGRGRLMLITKLGYSLVLCVFAIGATTAIQTSTSVQSAYTFAGLVGFALMFYSYRRTTRQESN